MDMGIGTDILIGVVIFVLLRRAISYIIRQKKKGVKCIGCPYAGECAAKAQGRDCGCPSELE